MDIPVSTGVVFGPAKRLKTSMLVSAFPRGLFLGAPPAIRLVAENEYGYTPTIWPWEMSASETSADYFGLPPRIETLPDLYEVLDMLDREGYANDFDAIVNDDLTPIAKRSVRMWKLEERRTSNNNIDFFYPYQQLDGFMIDVAGLIRHMGCHSWSTAWEREASVNPKTKTRTAGGPHVGSSSQSVQLPGWFDTNVRAIVSADYPDPWMKGALWANVSDQAEWITGDRNGIAINGVPVPPNVRELLRAARTPYRLSRLDELAWQDELADEVADAVERAGAQSREAWDVIDRVFGGNVPETPRTLDEMHLRWACQDGIARGVLRLRLRATISRGEATADSGNSRPGRPRPKPAA